MLRRLASLALSLLLAAALLAVLGTRAETGLPPLGALLDPLGGVYHTARQAAYPQRTELALDGLGAPVTVARDRRGVPHIFADDYQDAVAALGYVVARDRLFQLDFLPRVASGRLAEAFGPGSVETDRFLRATGMDWGAKKNLRRIRRQDGIERELLRSYAAGVNARLDELSAAGLPFEFRLLGYRPDRWRPLQSLRMLQYMNFDLTYRTDAASYADLRQRLGEKAYARLYPRFAAGLFAPIVPPGTASPAGSPDAAARTQAQTRAFDGASAALRAHDAFRRRLRGTPWHGFRPGKGSNNWAVAGSRSTTGRPILANDMHLSLSLPAVFYEAHIVTPEINAYGVTIPGAPGLVVSYTDHVAWGLTNTGADQIDHLALMLSDDGKRYLFEGEERPLRTVVDTIFVNGGAPVRDTLYYSHQGPVLMDEGPAEGRGAVALRWVAHDSSRTMRALYEMHRARDAGELREALRWWDTPMQNVIYADRSEIGIVSAGVLPVRRGGSGAGLLDGSTAASAWTGRVPFGDLPQSRSPSRGFLFSNNQQPTDSSYARYLGHDWRDGYRSMRIDSLLSRKPRHAPRDLQRYQSDVTSMQHAVLAPMLDTLGGPLAPRPDRLRRRLLAWDGKTATDRRTPVAFDAFYQALKRLSWDEAVFAGARNPQDAVLIQLLEEDPAARWLDIRSTPEREDGPALLRAALAAAADTLAARYGGPLPRWGAVHKVLFRHMTQNEALDALWRGPVAYPGYTATLSPARGDTATHSAAWRMVVDFSGERPQGVGIYPGGQSGNPFSPLYDLHLQAYVDFQPYRLKKPRRASDLSGENVLSRLRLVPEEGGPAK